MKRHKQRPLPVEVEAVVGLTRTEEDVEMDPLERAMYEQDEKSLANFLEELEKQKKQKGSE